MFPADGSGEVTEAGELAARGETEVGDGSGDNLALHLVEGVGDALVRGELLESSGTAGGLVGDHAANHAPQHAGGSAVVNGALGGVGQRALHQVVGQAQLIAEQRAGDGDGLGGPGRSSGRSRSP